MRTALKSNVLLGKGIVVTRPALQAESLCVLLAEHGAIPLRFPTLAIQPASDPIAATTQLAKAEHADLVIFISANAVEQAHALLPLDHLSRRAKLAVIGNASARALRQVGQVADLTPVTGNDSEALLALPELQQVSGWQVLIVRGIGGRETLAQTLRARGATVEYAEVYRRVIPPLDPHELIERWRLGQIHAVTTTSNETLQNLYDMVGAQGQAFLLATPLLVVSPRAAVLAQALGFSEPAWVATEAGDQALLDVLLAWANAK